MTDERETYAGELDWPPHPDDSPTPERLREARRRRFLADLPPLIDAMEEGLPTAVLYRQTQQDLAASQQDLTAALARRDQAIENGKFWMQDADAARAERDEARRELGRVGTALDMARVEIAQLNDRDAIRRAELAEAVADRDGVSLIADQLRTELTAAQQELAKREPCAWRDLAITAWRERDDARVATTGLSQTLEQVRGQRDLLGAQLEAALIEAQASRSWQVADRDAGPCAMCDRPIVRGQAFQPLADAKGYFAHVFCPSPEGATT